MSDAFMCDNCGKAVRQVGATGWYEVSMVGVPMPMVGVRSMAGHYCSYGCVVERFSGAQR